MHSVSRALNTIEIAMYRLSFDSLEALKLGLANSIEALNLNCNELVVIYVGGEHYTSIASSLAVGALSSRKTS